MLKLGRNYKLVVERTDGNTVTIQLPFTIEFDIHRNSLSSANVGSFRIYNLSPDNRNLIRKDQYDFDDIRRVSFFAGYGDKLSLAFQGNISQAWSVREGVDFITQIESYDGGFAFVNSIASNSFPRNTLESSVIDSIARSMPGLQVGAIGDYSGQLNRGNTYSGPSTQILTELTGGGFFVDNGKIFCLKPDECVDGDIPLINASSGLLNTPVKEQTYINFEMLFEPSLRVAQLIMLESQTADIFNGTHKVLSLVHRGVISDVVSGQAVTNVGLLPGTFKKVKEISG